MVGAGVSVGAGVGVRVAVGVSVLVGVGVDVGAGAGGVTQAAKVISRMRRKNLAKVI
jgi:hypothetical protein